MERIYRFFTFRTLLPDQLAVFHITVTMTLSRNAFFLLLFLICISPVAIWKFLWLSKTTATNGKVWFTGHTLELNGGISSHLVILFFAGQDSITFNAPANLLFKQGETVPVRYIRHNPSEARVNTPLRIWGDAIVYGIWPILVLLVIYLIPDSLDPLVPRKSKVQLNRKSIIKIIRE